MVGDGIGLLDLGGLGALASRLEINGGPIVGHPALSADGRRLAIGSPEGVRVYDAVSGHHVAGPYPLPLIPACGATPCASSFDPGIGAYPFLSADGRMLAYWAWFGQVEVVDTATGQMWTEPGDDFLHSSG